MFSSLANRKVRTKINLGFAVILLLLLVVAGTSLWGLMSAGEGFDRFAQVSQNTLSVALDDRDIVALRRDMLAYVMSGAETDAARFRELAARVKQNLEVVRADSQSAERKAALEALEAQATRYGAGFDTVIRMRARRVKAVDAMLPLGAGLTQGLGALMAGAVADGSFEEAAHAGIAHSLLSAARLDVWRFMATPDAKLLEATQLRVRELSTKMTDLIAEVHDPVRLGQARTVLASTGEYAAAVAEVGLAIIELDRQVTEVMPKIATTIAATITTLRESQMGALAGLRTTIGAANTTAKTIAIVLSVGALGFGVLLAWLIGNGIAKPVIGMTAAMRKLADGDTTVAIPAEGRGDEVGEMAVTVRVFRDNMIETERLRADRVLTRQRAEAERQQAMRDLAVKFEASVGGIVEGVASAATELQATARSMATTSEETSRRSTTVAAAAEQATQNVQTVAAATEELSASIREIGQQVTQASTMIQEGVHQASKSNEQVLGLTAAAEKIGDVVKIISDIAGQTNLLALNATIEAARAGDAGRGFAVVASEVKALATQTAKATQEIAAQITAIQEATQISARSIQSVTETITRVNETAAAIAAAVEEQGAATREISRNVIQAAQGTLEVSGNIAGVDQAARQTGEAAEQVLVSAAELSRNGEALKTRVEAFLSEVRVA